MTENENEQEEEVSPPPSPANPPVAEPTDPPKSTELIDNANNAADRMEKAAERLEKANSKNEALQVEKTLGGTADAGQGQQEETPAEYAKKVMANDLKT
jgi:hypothetical protein|tara:strand:+ start:5868 stop:6164 length:297 start_codon:yes stop_codon:yes gene_type:complete